MRKSVHVLMACCAIVPTIAIAAETDAQIVGRDIGAILAWRLGPEVIEEKCRDVDPAGADARAKALKKWQDKNGPLIAKVDERVAEIVPLAYPSPKPEDRVAAVRAQVKSLLLETISAEGDAEQLKTACKGETNPASARWNSNGLPHVENSLAALYDWKTQKEKK